MNIETYSKKIFGFAMSKTGKIEDAEDLSQEILFTIYNSKDKLDEVENIDAYIYKIAMYTWSNYIRKEKKNLKNISFMNEFHGEIEDTIEVIYKNEEKIDQLAYVKKELAYMGKQYRNIMVMKYFDNMKIKDIAEKLELSEGTVKWYLYDAKKKIKENIMKLDKNKACFEPIKLIIGHSGTPGVNDEPRCYFASLLTQNIAALAYEKPLTVEEMARGLSTAAIFIEEEVYKLYNVGLMKKIGDKYQTNFILTNSQNRIAHFIAKKPISEKLGILIYNTFIEQKNSIQQSNSIVKNLDYDYLLWTLIPYCIGEMLKRTDEYKNLEELTYPCRIDGGKYIAVGHILSDNSKLSPEEQSLCERAKVTGIKTRLKEDICFSYQLDFYYQGNIWREFNIGEVIYTLRLKEAQEEGRELDPIEKSTASELAKDGYIDVNDGKITFNIPIFEEKELETIFQNIMEELTHKGIDKMISKYFKEMKNFYHKNTPKSISTEERLLSLRGTAESLGLVCLDVLAQSGKLRLLDEKEKKSMCTLIQYKNQ